MFKLVVNHAHHDVCIAGCNSTTQCTAHLLAVQFIVEFGYVITQDKNFLEPEPQDIVAIKIAGVEDFKLGLVVCNKRSPRIKVRTLTGGRQDLPYVHSLNLGLMYRDPPKPSGEEIAAENAALERATVGIKKSL